MAQTQDPGAWPSYNPNSSSQQNNAASYGAADAQSYYANANPSSNPGASRQYGHGVQRGAAGYAPSSAAYGQYDPYGQAPASSMGQSGYGASSYGQATQAQHAEAPYPPASPYGVPSPYGASQQQVAPGVRRTSQAYGATPQAQQPQQRAQMPYGRQNPGTMTSAVQGRPQDSYGQGAQHRSGVRAVGAYPADPYAGAHTGGSRMPAPTLAYEEKSKRPSPVIMVVIGLIAGLLIGALVMFFVSGALSDAPKPVAASLQESQLDTVVGTYRYQDDTYKITAREAILGTKSLAAARNSDGTYQTPSTDMVVSFARNQILAQLVRDNGIEVSGEEVAAYARDLVGTDDMSAVASYFSMDEAQAQQILTEAASVRKLREQVVGSVASILEPPSYPADGATEVGNADYATYIIGLIGSNWDSEAGTWANTENRYYDVLKDKVFAPGSASYDAAQAAYAVALEQMDSTGISTRDAWTAWLNQYLDEGSIAVATLRA